MTRRYFLSTALGMAAGGLALAPLKLNVSKNTIRQVGTVADLIELALTQPVNGTVVITLGYYSPGDGGGLLVYWDAASERMSNGGTVIGAEGNAKGRWIQLHEGVVDFRQFGIFDAQVNADDALETMVNDPSIHCIEAHTPLNFVRRHHFYRSNLTLDFGGQTVTTVGIEPVVAGQINALAAVLFFGGKPLANTMTVTLDRVLPEQTDIFPVTDSSQFSVGQWYQLESDARGGRLEKELQKLVQVTQIVDAKQVRVNYKNGWALPIGRQLRWSQVSIVEQVHISNMRFIGHGTAPNTSSHPIAFEYAVSCNISEVHAESTFWSVVIRRWCTNFRTERCSLTNPVNIKYGGAGYLAQHIYCLYGHISGCSSANARHLNDFVASAYCTVENCCSNGDNDGTFVTHGQYEHDLVYSGNSGAISFANSGKQWGASAKRIAVRSHICTLFIANEKVTDLTLDDVYVRRVNGQPTTGIMRLNADGLQIRGCTVESELTLVQHTDLSSRPNTFNGCSFRLDSRHDLTSSAEDPLGRYCQTHLPQVERNSIDAQRAIFFNNCTFEGNQATASLWIAAHKVALDACQIKNLALCLTGMAEQHFTLSGNTTLLNTTKQGVLLSRTGNNRLIHWRLGPYQSIVAHPDVIHIQLMNGVNRYQATQVHFVRGKILLAPAAFNAPSFLVETGRIEEDKPHAVGPPLGDRVSIRGTLFV
ncbi:hypothetical protein [Mycoavidus sp. B2-EB]|uniref:hypothetical protein n=1 Tax=Mycoavidus sp. B2-EB TaxID=2651972 RepID=UPI0016288279|nr:hypothetical protein [Mycoavidus sp. B2-EB]BBO60037.1 hypothetical protein MPB2EB_1173 [Mycoavidus sp. B2-EB]